MSIAEAIATEAPPGALEAPQPRQRRTSRTSEQARYVGGARNPSPERLLETLRASFNLQSSPPSTQVETAYDTFDGRIQAMGWTLRACGTAAEPDLELREGGRVLHREICAPVPGMVDDLPDGALRDALAPVVGIRRMLAHGTVQSWVQPARVLDKERKTVVRLYLERADAGGPIALRICAVRGYPKRYKALKRFATRHLGLTEARGTDGLAPPAVSIPEHRTRKLKVPLEPELPTVDAMKAIYKTLLTTIEDNVEGTRDDLDSEFLHDLRVAVRRTRAALSQVKGVFPSRTTLRFKMQFRWLGQVTGPTRDLDVYLLKIPSYLESLSPRDRAALAPLQAYLEQRQRAEQQQLAAALRSRRFADLTRSWRAVLDSPSPTRSTLANATRPCGEVASERIWKVYRRVIRDGRRIGPETPATPVHDLRLLCKKLRYLMELFRGLYDDDTIAKRIKELKRLQENLGDFNDLEVQQLALTTFARDMTSSGSAPVETLMAMGRLVSQLEAEQQRVRTEFADRFAAFSSPTTRERFHDLFAPPPFPPLPPGALS